MLPALSVEDCRAYGIFMLLLQAYFCGCIPCIILSSAAQAPSLTRHKRQDKTGKFTSPKARLGHCCLSMKTKRAHKPCKAVLVPAQ